MVRMNLPRCIREYLDVDGIISCGVSKIFTVYLLDYATLIRPSTLDQSVPKDWGLLGGNPPE